MLYHFYQGICLLTLLPRHWHSVSFTKVFMLYIHLFMLYLFHPCINYLSLLSIYSSYIRLTHVFVLYLFDPGIHVGFVLLKYSCWTCLTPVFMLDLFYPGIHVGSVLPKYSCCIYFTPVFMLYLFDLSIHVVSVLPRYSCCIYWVWDGWRRRTVQYGHWYRLSQICGEFRGLDSTRTTESVLCL